MNCSICFNVLLDKTKTLKKCGHEFHSMCIEKWFECKNTCPICRNPNMDEPTSASISSKLISIRTIYFLKIIQSLKNKSSSINFCFKGIDDKQFGVYNFHNEKLIKILNCKDVDQSYKF